jgi:predicted transport protein
LKAEFPIVPLYSFRISKHTLRKLENFHHRKEPIDIENYTIEHIMPQNKDLSPTWRRELGEHWQEIHQKYLHTVGNLTITGYNAELGDLPFLEKRDREGGFVSSPLSLNHRLAKLDHWNGEEIEKRASELTNIAVQIWPAPFLENSILERHKQSKQVETGRVYTEEDHLRRGDDSIRRLYGILKNKVLQLGDSITVRPVQHCIGFAKNEFIAIRIRRAYLLVDLVTHEGFIDSKDISVQAHKTHYGGRIRCVRVASEAIFSDLVPLIRQTYEKA